jgi:hypothetical protein
MPVDKMNVRDFGDALIETRDLDPVYCGLVGARLPEPQLCRWLLAYWCFYHVGAASCISQFEGAEFWGVMKVAAENAERPGFLPPSNLGITRWPRAAERRHFRGQKCVDAVEWLAKLEPEMWVRSLSVRETDKDLMHKVQKWPMFGPWIAFKAADMMERVYGTKVQFDRNLGLMYEEPRKALDILVSSFSPSGEVWTAERWYNALLTYFSARRAPPSGDRYCGPQEVETVLCKWKSYMGGHYRVGKDIHEQRQALAGWGETAERINKAYPSEVAAGRYA